MEDKNLKVTLELLDRLSTGVIGSEIEILSSKGFRIVEARKGFFRFHFTVPSYLGDQDGNWLAGAIATLIDNLGADTVHSIHGEPHVTVEFNISYYSTAKVEDEVEIVAKVAAERGKLISHVVEITRKNDGELIAVGKQWMTIRGRQSRL